MRSVAFAFAEICLYARRTRCPVLLYASMVPARCLVLMLLPAVRAWPYNKEALCAYAEFLCCERYDVQVCSYAPATPCPVLLWECSYAPAAPYGGRVCSYGESGTEGGYGGTRQRTACTRARSKRTLGEVRYLPTEVRYLPTEDRYLPTRQVRYLPTRCPVLRARMVLPATPRRCATLGSFCTMKCVMWTPL
eukprot:770017-Rhodomonas_salina.3